MKQQHYFTDKTGRSAVAIVKGIDRDVEWGEDILMLGLGIVMLSSTFAPIAPPQVLLPLVALTFAITSSLARINYHRMERRLSDSMKYLESHEQAKLRPICQVFVDQPMGSLTESYNPLKNIKRLAKSAIGAVLINPLWLPIFYTMGIQIVEEDNLQVLNKAVMRVEKSLGLLKPVEQERETG
ncbi:MAG: hypothetical protein FJ190_05455 [Gammaproteobacteria bacterium]|nr:hypothetical protein [Gammaproteobacteria bacterium]